uniref:Uncharacterized protein n=1 Tax=Kalanchoe fedtschenkoi TaxID=63787 RepID=A0A7N0VFM1_KALFE
MVMAFHVACPITCKKICFCDLGLPRALPTPHSRHAFLHDVFRLYSLLPHPFPAPHPRHHTTLQVPVPKILKPPTPPPPVLPPSDADEAAFLLSAQTKRVALQREAAVASLAAEDYASRFESGQRFLTGAPRDAGGDQGLTNANVMCRICFQGENEGSERSRKMVSCKDCGKKYHRSCIKNWGKRRDLFHWSSWTCPSCRVCEVSLFILLGTSIYQTCYRL